KASRIKFPTPAACGKTPLFAKGLTKMYGSLEVFAGVDLAIDKGSRVVVLGYNGAGKTTTLKLLMRLVFPTSGSAAILGRPLDDLAMRRRIGFLPENPTFYDYLTGEELL
ncbi:ATP-binding cassette domain-containing protein, partial [Klebsiella pneumoniae]|uniref:ATP-binding cassette domain-containing protein n=1 Tax=Klebsiella pneumoniae TaxID=573 RepID=UPI003A85337E